MEKQYWHKQYERQGKETHYKDNPCKNLGHFPRFTNDGNKITCKACLRRFKAKKICSCCGTILEDG